MKTTAFKVQLSKGDDELIITFIEQPNELLAVLAASQAYPGFTVDSIATILYSLHV